MSYKFIFSKDEWFALRSRCCDLSKFAGCKNEDKEERIRCKLRLEEYEGNHHNQITAYLYEFPVEHKVWELARIFDNKEFGKLDAL